MKNNHVTRVEPEAQYGSRLAGEILHDNLENSNEPLAVAYREHTSETEGWNRNTDLCCDVKTFLRNDRTTKIGKDYPGVLTRDEENHYSFVETLPSTDGKRNPHVFEGEFITLTRKDDGTYRPNFRPIKKEAGWSVDGYANGVANEIRKALKGLVEESEY